MKEGDKEGGKREKEREGDELMELLLGIFFALSLVERGRQASARLFVATTIQRAGGSSGKKLTPDSSVDPSPTSWQSA